MYIDDEFDGLRATMLVEFERMAKANATAIEDINHRIGFYTGLTLRDIHSDE